MRMSPRELKLIVMDRITLATQHGRINETKAARVGDLRPGIEEDGVGPRGDSGERTDAERQRQHRGDGKTGGFAQLPQRKAKISKKRRHRFPSFNPCATP